MWLFVFLVAVVYIVSFPWAGDDTFEMIATVRAASENLVHPQNPMLDLPGDTSPRFTPYAMTWAVIVRLLGVSAVSTIQFSAIINLILFATGLSRLLRVEYRDKRLVTMLVPIMLVCWGSGFAMANGYYWLLFFMSLTYVAVFAYGVGFHALAELAHFLKSKRSRHLWSYAILSLVVFLSHPITGVFVFMVAAVMAFFESSAKRTLLLQAVPFAAVAAIIFWPYFDYLKTLTSGAAGHWYKEIMFANQISAIGVALVGVPLAVWYGIRRQHLPVVLLLGLFSCGYFLSWALDISIGARFLFFAMLTMHLLLALYALETFDKLRQSPRPIPVRLVSRVVLILAVVLVGVKMRGWEIKHSGEIALRLIGALPEEVSVKDRYAFLENDLGAGDIVLAEGETGWPVPGMTGARLVYHQHGNPLLADELETRLNATTRFLSNVDSEDEMLEAARKYHVSHVLVDLKRVDSYAPGLFNKLDDIGTRVEDRDSLLLYRINTTK